LPELFDAYPQAVIAVRAERIFYANPAAMRLIADLAQKSPGDIFPAHFLSPETGSFTGELALGGENVPVTAAVIDDCRIFTIFTPARGNTGDAGMILSSAIEDFRKTLSVVKIASDFVMPVIENLGDANMTRYAAMMHRGYYNLLRTSGHLESLRDALRDGGTLAYSDFDLVGVCDNLISTAGHLVGDDCAQLGFETRVTQLDFRGDLVKLEQMILTLLTNSLLFTPKSGRVTLVLSRMADSALLTVRDTGEGVPNVVRDGVWTRYGEEKELFEPRFGAGFGLTVVRHIARLHGGTCVMESLVGKGSSVTVSLPIVKPETTNVNDPGSDYFTSSIQGFLTELAPVIPAERYIQRYTD
jgi:hypothetical protein